jgi:hypothetical protein
VKCSRCGGPLACAVCGTAADTEAAAYLEELVTRTFPDSVVTVGSQDDRYFLIVARGHRDLLTQIQGLVGGMGWVRVIEDRRRDQNLLPREGREGTTFGG